jgi:UDP-3-O-[3-hydroxymyristoyl] N-acetylglucosamine deacetylase
MIKQRSIKNTVHTRGIALHSGQFVNLTLKTAPKNTGIIFRRVDLSPVVEISAYAFNVNNTEMATTLSATANDGTNVSISTIEHLMSALAGFGIDNIYIEMDGPEVPILDGSSSLFVFLIQSAGLIRQEAEKKFIVIKKTISVEEDGKSATLSPYNGFKLDFQIDFNHKAFHQENNHYSINFSSTNFIQFISKARTFGFTRDLEYLQKHNLAKGASLNNAIVIDENGVTNENGLHYDNELVRHKILDAIGDIYLIGYSIIGSYVGIKSGHKLNNQLIRKLLNDQESYEITSFENLEELPMDYVRF